MEDSIESQIWRLLPALENLNSDDDQANALATTAADNLRLLIERGVFSSLTGKAVELMLVIAGDPESKDSDRAVAKVLLTAFDALKGYATLSHREIIVRSQLSAGTVRASLRRLVSSGYFRAIAPSEAEWSEGDHTLKYEPQFDAHLMAS